MKVEGRRSKDEDIACRAGFHTRQVAYGKAAYANNQQTNKLTTRLVFLALLLALGIVLYIIESLYLSPLPIPGAKLGLTSIVTLMMLISFSWQECLLNVILRTIIGSLIGGTFLAPPFFFSLTGALASAIVMILVYKNFYGKFSLVGISLTGATTHNFAQLVFARFFIGQAAVFLYLPFLVFLATVTGFLNGMTANFLVQRIENGRN